VPGPARFSEDEIDERVRHDLGRWEKKGEVRLTGQDGPREFAVTGNEAGKALRSFIKTGSRRSARSRTPCWLRTPSWPTACCPRAEPGPAGPGGVRAGGRGRLPDWFTHLDADAVQARCLKDALAQVREHGVSLAELLILLAAVALVAPDAARAQTAALAPPPYSHPG
jgi:deoxyribodipyrimidine photolyase-related protein